MKSIEDRFEKKHSSWKGKLMLYGAHLVLINTVLKILPMFMLSFLEIPKGVQKDWIITDPDSSGNVMNINGSIG